MAVDLHAVVLDRAPLGLEELIAQVRMSRDLDVAGPRDTVLEHRGQRHAQLGQMRIEQARVRPVVIHGRDPFTDDRFEFVEEEERLRLGTQAAGVDIRPFATRQRLHQILP
ncbi:hypothetical protein GCM10022226_80660 [Sphaerisporangium flaviroseum]|uniref:Uncharacterized protein n=1 Tax=Sphaerisporangium flaviroseum TaxID=509199 RepID=A0ABP7JJ14_9ACTN